MTCQEIQSRITASVVDRTDLTVAARQHVETCAACRAEWVELQRLWSALADVETPEPSTDSAARFQRWLASQSAAAARTAVPAASRRRWVWQFAAALGCLAVGFALGEVRARSDMKDQELARVKGEMESVKQLLAVSMLGQSSASARLRGASLASDLSSPQEPVVGALVRTLEEDENVNVRLAAVDSLAAAADSRQVRRSLVEALAKQDSPTVQLALIGLLGDLRERSVEPVARRLAADENVNPVVRKQAEQLAQRVTRQ
jgi:hypothetical protein